MSRLAYMLKQSAAIQHNPQAAQTLGQYLRQAWHQTRYPIAALLGVLGATQIGRLAADQAMMRNFPDYAQGVNGGRTQ